MSDDEAKALHAKLTNFLTAAQKAELAKMGPGGMRGGRDGDPGGRDGMRGPGGREGGRDGMRGGMGGFRAPPSEKQMQELRQRFEKMRTFMTSFNPLYPVSSYKEFKSLPERMQERFADHYQDQQNLISQLA